MSNTALSPFVNVFGLAPGCVYPSMTIEEARLGNALYKEIVFTVTLLVGGIANWIVTGGVLVFAALIASRNEPAPLSFALVTVMIVAANRPAGSGTRHKKASTVPSVIQQ